MKRTLFMMLVTAATGAPACAQTGGSASQGIATPAATAPVALSSQAASPVDSHLRPITLHIAGDSTVSNYPATTRQEGWGQEIGQFFNDKVKVNNQAIGGANVKTFRAGNWKKITAALQAGDYVLLQFGANDSGTAHGPVVPAEFVKNYEEMADEVKAKGATPIFVTPSAFFQWSGTTEDNARLAPYAVACYESGKARDVFVVDLNARGVEWLNQIGQEKAKDFYLPNSQGVPDKAHFVKAGAEKMAELVAAELKRVKSPLAEYLK